MDVKLEFALANGQSVSLDTKKLAEVLDEISGKLNPDLAQYFFELKELLSENYPKGKTSDEMQENLFLLERAGWIFSAIKIQPLPHRVA